MKTHFSTVKSTRGIIYKGTNKKERRHNGHYSRSTTNNVLRIRNKTSSENRNLDIEVTVDMARNINLTGKRFLLKQRA